jgi:hypothetical protein
VNGLLDLHVAGYVHFDRDNLPLGGSNAMNYAFCQYRGVSVNCGPRGLEGEPDHLFHNNGDGIFADVTVKSGVGETSHTKSSIVYFAKFQINDPGSLACNRPLCLCDLLEKNAPDPARAFFVQTEVRALFQHIQRVPKFQQKGGIGSAVHLAKFYPILRVPHRPNGVVP